MKKGLLGSGFIASILGALGLAACCIPFVTAGLAGVGISILFFHRISQYFLYAGIALILIAGLTYFWRKNDKDKN